MALNRFSIGLGNLFFFKLKTMRIEEIIKLAEEQAKVPLDQLESKLQELKNQGFHLLTSIIFIRYNQNISLGDAKLLVLDSKTWEERALEFYENNNAMWQEIDDDINSAKTNANNNKISYTDKKASYVDIEDLDIEEVSSK